MPRLNRLAAALAILPLAGCVTTDSGGSGGSLWPPESRAVLEGQCFPFGVGVVNGTGDASGCTKLVVLYGQFRDGRRTTQPPVTAGEVVMVYRQKAALERKRGELHAARSSIADASRIAPEDPDVRREHRTIERIFERAERRE